MIFRYPLFYNLEGGYVSCFFIAEQIMFLEKNVKDTPYGRDVIKHEWGHFVQLSILGVPKFVVFFAVPSMLSGGSSNYYSLPWERSADLFGGVSGSNWSSPHTSNSDIYSILYLIGVFVI